MLTASVSTVGALMGFLYAEFLMNSGDWEKVFAALIIAFFAYMTARMERLRRDQSETKKIVNGRMEELKQEAYSKGLAEGHALGIAAACQAVGNNPNIPMTTQELAKEVAETATATAKQKGK